MNKIFAVAGVVIKELYRRKDFYVLFILTVLITGLMWLMNFFHDEQIIRFIKEICLLLIWISSLVIAVTTAARQIPFERESRTIFPLLAKPISRWQVMIGKFVGCWLATGVALLVFYIFFGLVSASREHTLPVDAYFQAFWLHWQMLGIVIAMTLLGSVALSTPAANMTIVFIITIGILAMGGFLHKLAEHMAEPSASLLTAIYFVIPHLELFNMRELIIHGWTGAALPRWIDVLGGTVYGLAYSAFFLITACLVFRRKALN
ncbi:MAG TPA: ABC transporter permease subunit [Verrucomicrobiae bacterium]|jgi:ABC-type transport system involved in multi-copper enzyme maturation permease subunit|nr:ABC transporter permease subunit [Verrucomicrobiae bacterium]